MSDKSASSGAADQGSKNNGQATDTGNKSLSDLLDEYDKGSRADGNDKSAKPPKNEIDSLKSELAALKAEAAERSYQTGIRGVIETLKGDLDVDDFVVEAWANKQASDDERLQKLWEERDSRKREFSEAIAALKPEFQKYAQEKILAHAKKDDGDKNGLIAAVRSARDSSPGGDGFDDVNWSGLSDDQLALKEREVFRLAKAGKLN